MHRSTLPYQRNQLECYLKKHCYVLRSWMVRQPASKEGAELL